MKHYRIVKRVYSDTTVKYVVQERLYGVFWWVDASRNYDYGTNDTFDSLESARESCEWYKSLIKKKYTDTIQEIQ